MTLTLSSRYMNETGDKEVRRTSSGILVIRPFLPADIPNNILGILKGVADADTVERVIALSADNFSLPSFGVDTFNVGHFNENIKFPSKATNEELTFTARDFVDTPTADIFDAWYSAVYNVKDGSINQSFMYKLDAYVFLFGADYAGGGEDSRRYYILEGCYPTRVERGDIDHSSGDYVKIAVTLAYDRVIPDFLDGDKSDNFAGGKGGRFDFKLQLPENLV